MWFFMVYVYICVWMCVSFVSTRAARVDFPKRGDIQRCFNFIPGISAFHVFLLAPLKRPIMLLIKFMLEYWEEWEAGVRGGKPNSCQGHVPVESANNASANPSSSTVLWPHPRTRLWERTGGPPCSQPSPELLDYLPISTISAGRH